MADENLSPLFWKGEKWDKSAIFQTILYLVTHYS